MNKKIIISGGTGFIGTQLVHKLIEKGYEVFIISRTNNPSFNDTKTITWDSLGVNDFENIVGVINLAGASIAGKKWSDEYKKVILESRIKTTGKLVSLISKAQKAPKCFINASAVGYYGDRGDEILSEKSSKGMGFLAKVCSEWEKEAVKASKYTRTVMSRIGVVLDKNEGALAKMLLPFRLFIGGPLGSGEQYFPWIHIKDIVGLFVFAIENDSVEGPVNFAAPNPVTMKEFSSQLGRSMSRPAFFKVPEFALKLMLGESAEMLTNSQRVQPEKALKLGYNFNYSEISPALNELMQRKE
jgi:uncharacterized protein